ncbi:MAG TPA: hypothetical protein VMV84_05225 [Dehalococcoidales bacterium]|nr:hypothetical protein [Dehalococcoidales bacterium]
MVEKAKEEGVEAEEALELETLEVETQLVEAAVKVETARRMTEAEIESHYQAFLKKTRGGK